MNIGFGSDIGFPHFLSLSLLGGNPVFAGILSFLYLFLSPQQKPNFDQILSLLGGNQVSTEFSLLGGNWLRWISLSLSDTMLGTGLSTETGTQFDVWYMRYSVQHPSSSLAKPHYTSRISLQIGTRYWTHTDVQCGYRFPWVPNIGLSSIKHRDGCR